MRTIKGNKGITSNVFDHLPRSGIPRRIGYWICNERSCNEHEISRRRGHTTGKNVIFGSSVLRAAQHRCPGIIAIQPKRSCEPSHQQGQGHAHSILIQRALQCAQFFSGSKNEVVSTWLHTVRMPTLQPCGVTCQTTHHVAVFGDSTRCETPANPPRSATLPPDSCKTTRIEKRPAVTQRLRGKAGRDEW